MARKKKHEEHENHERWLVSYADLLTLLFAFFVVMYAVSRVDIAKAQQVAESVRFAMHFSGTGGVGAMPIFDGPPSEGGCMANTGVGGPRQGLAESKVVMENLRKRIEKKLKPFLMEKKGPTAVQLQLDDARLTIRMSATNFFDPAQAALRPEMLPVLDAIAAELAVLDRPVRVEGHPDDIPVTSARFRNNWDLSAARAVSVVDYLEQVHQVRPERLSAVGYGSTRPVASGDSPEAHEENRRIELSLELPEAAAKGFPVR
jgi:chemotaxis protein MotB